jgi:hypothetical protein
VTGSAVTQPAVGKTLIKASSQIHIFFSLLTVVSQSLSIVRVSGVQHPSVLDRDQAALVRHVGVPALHLLVG